MVVDTTRSGAGSMKPKERRGSRFYRPPHVYHVWCVACLYRHITDPHSHLYIKYSLTQ